MEVLYVTISFVLVVLGIFIIKKFNSKRIESDSKRIESERKKSLSVKLEEIKSKNFDKLSINELEDLKEQILKLIKDIDPLDILTDLLFIEPEFIDLKREEEQIKDRIIYSSDMKELEDLKKEIKIRQENNLDFRKFQEDLDWKKSRIKEDYFSISNIDRNSSEWLFREEIISEEEFKISIKLYNERVSSNIKSQILLLLKYSEERL